MTVSRVAQLYSLPLPIHFSAQLTYIGVGIFVTMDVSDIFLAVGPARQISHALTDHLKSLPNASTMSLKPPRYRSLHFSSASGRESASQRDV
jgi:hypothetical protein